MCSVPRVPWGKGRACLQGTSQGVSPERAEDTSLFYKGKERGPRRANPSSRSQNSQHAPVAGSEETLLWMPQPSAFPCTVRAQSGDEAPARRAGERLLRCPACLFTARDTHSETHAQPVARTARDTHSQGHAQLGTRTAGNMHSQGHAQLGTRTAGHTHSQAPAQPDTRTASDTHSRAHAQPGTRTARHMHSQ